MKIQIGDKVQTPRFCTVRIAAMFENVKLAEDCGFTNSTDFRDEDYHILGKSIGENRMLFAAAGRV
jgi:hypothetical protein